MANNLAGTKTNIRILAWLHIIPSLLGWILGGAACFIMVGVALFAEDRAATGALLLMALGVFSMVTLLCIPALLTGWGLWRFKSWARILALCLGLLNLAAFPIGTVLGAYTFFSLLTPEASEVFAGQ